MGIASDLRCAQPTSRNLLKLKTDVDSHYFLMMSLISVVALSRSLENWNHYFMEVSAFFLSALW